MTYRITPNLAVQTVLTSGTSLVMNNVFVPLHTDVLVVCITANAGSSQAPTGVTYGAQSMTSLHRRVAGGIQTMIYTLYSPTPGTATLTATFDLSTDGGIHAFIIAGTHSPVDFQAASAGGSASSASVTFTNFADFAGEGASDLFLTIIGTPTGAPDITPTASQVADLGLAGTGVSNGSFGRSKAYLLTGAIGTTFVDSYTFSPSTPYTMITAHFEHFGIEDGKAVVVR